MGEHDEATPHLARSARHPLPKGEGCISDFGPPCPAKDVGRVQPLGRGETPNSLPFSWGRGQKTEGGAGAVRLPLKLVPRIKSCSSIIGRVP